MEDGESFDQPGSAATSEDAATHDTQPPAPAPDLEQPSAAQVVPVATDENGEGWGLVGLFKDGIGYVDVGGNGQGTVELADDANGITRLTLTGAAPSSVVNLTVTPKIEEEQ